MSFRNQHPHVHQNSQFQFFEIHDVKYPKIYFQKLAFRFPFSAKKIDTSLGNNILLKCLPIFVYQQQCI